ncbi:hypothetical protein FGL79_09010 [Latilactobacillus curvatus]|uniref:hypothetical protein n=1 Tax=Latilactobacillus curvatus TaxID=28038 RepID=UPI0011BB7EB5|nr:hypothetical protein [Latilactobacillus curvatus]QEA49932.1 hypothetical protein FGL79_09010 [Latilactobacillus curvatus]
MNSDKYECLYNMSIITGVLEGVEEHMIEKPHKTKATLHQLNQEIQEYLKNYGVDFEAVMTKAKKDGKQNEN